MQTLTEHVVEFFACVLALLVVAAFAGSWLRNRRPALVGDSLKTLEGAVLGLLALLLGFSFAMAVSRYDNRRQLEVDEANAIGTTWLRTDTLVEPARTQERDLLRSYVQARLAFFDAGTESRSILVSLQHAGELQTRMWSIAASEASTRRDPVSAAFISTMNDSIDLSEKRTAAFENRIPSAAWALLLFIAAISSLLIGMNAGHRWLLLALPLVVAAAMMLIADLDSPRSGFVVVPQMSMERLAAQVGVR